MASYRPFPPPPQSTFAAPQPNQNPLPPPPAPPPQQSRGGNSQYTQSWGGYAGGGDAPPNYTQNYTQMHPPPPNYQQHYAPPPPPPPRNQIPQPPQQYPYPPPPPPPPPESSYPPPPPPSMPVNVPPQPAPPASMYYPSSQYSHFNHHQPPLQPLQPPPPPPPPPSSPPSLSFPPPPPPTQPPSPPPPPAITQSRESKPAPTKQHRAAIPPIPGRKLNGPSGGRIETEEERRVRKKKELEKQRQDDKHRQQLKDSQNKVLQKTQMLSSGIKGQASISGSHMGDRRATPFLSGERSENRLKKPTTFLCKLKFRNELPDPTAQPKLLSLRRDKDRPSKGEKLHLDPEDEELLRDDDPVTPIKKDGFKRKERPIDQGFSWLVKTQYISPLSMEATKQSLTEKQAKELRDNRGGRNILENFNNRYDDQFVVATFDSAPTADSEIYSKFEKPVRDAHECQAIMKSFMATTSDSAKPDKFLAYMVPSTDELSKDIYDEHEDVSFTWVREYHYDVRGDTADDPTTYLVAFGESEARYAPLPTKLILRKKRAKEGKSSEEVEHFPVPSRVTVRRRSTASAVELKEPGSYSSTKGSSKTRRVDMEGRRQHVVQDTDMDQSSGAEYSD
ncbi:hypothetical protein RJ640_008553 [Escallonia rubra]|uniref:Uncharacterized protein n=1 Tax=Escallonia rubra TaxID=112253 RepID=A0AA88U4S4_9ASTE|nr:hypothetical protein RJ640_008553 [Escallonia rubra]